MTRIFSLSRGIDDCSQRRFADASKLVRSFGVACIVSIAVISACGGKVERDQASFEKDRVALTDVRRIGALISRSQKVEQRDLDLLKNIHAKYPKADEVRQTLQFALQLREDWDALEKLLTEKPESDSTQQEQIFLAKVYLKLGKYSNASRIAGPKADSAPNDLELNSIAGRAWYYEGKYDDAARAFDRVWDALISSKQLDEVMMRGMIYFYKGDNVRAIDTLKKTLAIYPEYAAGNNALSRIYAASGDQKQADIYRVKAEQSHAMQTAEEARRMRLVSRSLELESAFAAGRYGESVKIARELLLSADASQKPVLYEYLGKAYQAMGNETEAQAAFQEAARLRDPSKS
jgi:predicted Zn-dependent protease